MKKRKLGNTGMEISPVIFGGIICMNETPEDSKRFVSYALENGVNYFDVAPSYADAEIKLGPALEPYRKDVFLACKTGRRDEAGGKKEFESSLRQLRTDFFDNYQLHALSSLSEVDEAFSSSGIMPYLIQMKEKGYARHLGITAHNEDAAIEALNRYPFETVLFPVNWALNLKTGFGDRLSMICASRNVGFLAIKALAHRSWDEGEARRYPKSWCKTIYDNDALSVAALKFSLSKGAIAIDPPGNFEQFQFTVEHIAECMENPFSDEDLKLLKQEFEPIKERMIFN
ncbi:MAG: aldo/keto reductase [Clostridiales bacterium]|nr:aldo/keto reductase [Clostridiales bacterium]